VADHEAVDRGRVTAGAALVGAGEPAFDAPVEWAVVDGQRVV
jgi:hypothetical protein